MALRGLGMGAPLSAQRLVDLAGLVEVGRDPFNSGRAGRKGHRLIEALLASLQSGRAVAVAVAEAWSAGRSGPYNRAHFPNLCWPPAT
jgi:hypothetical protein